jgi:hypothetical protein
MPPQPPEKFAAEMGRPQYQPHHDGLDPDDPGEPIRRPNRKPVFYSLSFSGATELAAQIRTYWAAQGYAIETIVEPFTGYRGGGFGMRSSLCNGKPE